MSKPKTVLVTNAPGACVPLHHTTACLPGGGLMIVKDGNHVELPLDAYVRRRIRAGDLVIVKSDAKVTKPKES